jgi:phytoene dehydrogenase-like protein
MQAQSADVIVVGGGLSGLATAAYLAREGRGVVLLEKAPVLGGRAGTQARNGFHLNFGPHALYRTGEGAKALHELGVRWTGGVPSASGGYAIDRGRRHALPGGFVSLLTTGLFGVAAKLEAARLLAGFAKVDVAALQSVTVRRFLARHARHDDVRRLFAALFRLSTYANDPERQSAGSAVAQLQLALAGGVVYLDGGWQTLVDGLAAAARAAGAALRTGCGVEAVEPAAPGLRVRLRDGATFAARAVVVAAPPAIVHELLGLPGWPEAMVPVRAACLDLALSRLPEPRARFALGIDRPLYLSVHSAVAKLSPEGAAVVQLAKYLEPGAPDEQKADERELEALADLLQPGWRSAVVERRFLPSMVVSNALVTAEMGGAAGRPGPEVPGMPGAWVVGDWVGPEGLLIDASLASARRAARLVARRLDAGAAAAA